MAPSSLFPNDDNPYAAPQHGFEPPSSGEVPQDLRKLVKDFRSQSLALGVLWVIFAVIVGGLAVALVQVNNFPGIQAEPDFATTLALIMGCIGTGWLISGVGTLMKQMWGIYVGLAMSYLAIVGNLINLNLCGIVLIVIVLLQAHRVLSFANKMRAAGLALDAQI